MTLISSAGFGSQNYNASLPSVALQVDPPPVYDPPVDPPPVNPPPVNPPPVNPPPVNPPPVNPPPVSPPPVDPPPADPKRPDPKRPDPKPADPKPADPPPVVPKPEPVRKGFTVDGPSPEFGNLNRSGGFSGGVGVPVGGDNYRRIPEGQITFSVPMSGNSNGTTGYIDVRVRALGTAPLGSVNFGVNQPLVGDASGRPDRASLSVNLIPLTVGGGENGLVIGGTIGANARLPLNSSGTSSISAGVNGTVNYLNGAPGAEATIRANVKVGTLPGFGDLDLVVGGTRGVAQGQAPSTLVFVNLQSRAGKSAPTPYEVVTETEVISPNVTKSTSIGNIVLNNPGQQESLRPGVPVNNLTPADSTSKPLYTVQRREESTSTVDGVSYRYRVAYDANPLDDKPGLAVEFISNQRLDEASIVSLRRTVRAAASLNSAEEYLTRKGFTNFQALPLNPQLNEAIESFRQITTPTNYQEIVTNIGTIFISQDGQTIRINKNELSLPPGQNPTLEERMAVFNRSTEVTDPRELQMYREIVFQAFQQYRVLNGQYPQPSGIPLDNGTNGRRPTF